jgi:general transcription factor 3C polypeptide 1
MGLNVNPGLELTIMQYCVLERIGRSRYMGEVTQGKVSLQLMGEDPKALFYHRKFLMKHKLIVKQVKNVASQNYNCSTLKNFFASN